MSDESKPTCQFCMSALEITDAGGNPWFECGTTMGFKSSTCQGREPMAVKLREAQERIKRLEEALDCVIIDCSFLGHKRKHRHEHNEPCPVEELIRKAKEAKP